MNSFPNTFLPRVKHHVRKLSIYKQNLHTHRTHLLTSKALRADRMTSTLSSPNRVRIASLMKVSSMPSWAREKQINDCNKAHKLFHWKRHLETAVWRPGPALKAQQIRTSLLNTTCTNLSAIFLIKELTLLKQRAQREMTGQWDDGSVGEGPCHQTWQFEFNLQYSHGGPLTHKFFSDHCANTWYTCTDTK